MPQPSGIMNFKLDGVSTDNATIGAIGAFTFTESSAPSAGAHAVQLAYPGDANFDPAQSSVDDITVNPPPTRNVVINFTVNPAQPVQGQPYTISGTIVSA